MVVTVGAADTVVTAVAAGEEAFQEGAYSSGREGELLLPG